MLVFSKYYNLNFLLIEFILLRIILSEKDLVSKITNTIILEDILANNSSVLNISHNAKNEKMVKDDNAKYNKNRTIIYQKLADRKNYNLDKNINLKLIQDYISLLKIEKKENKKNKENKNNDDIY